MQFSDIACVLQNPHLEQVLSITMSKLLLKLLRCQKATHSCLNGKVSSQSWCYVYTSKLELGTCNSIHYRDRVAHGNRYN